MHLPHVKPPVLSFAVGSESHQPVGQVRNLDVTLDVHLTMEVHIKRVCQVPAENHSNLNVWLPEALERLVYTFVIAHFDYCNSILVGILDAAVQKLQLLQNSAARLV